VTLSLIRLKRFFFTPSESRRIRSSVGNFGDDSATLTYEFVSINSVKFCSVLTKHSGSLIVLLVVFL
jgi:hypothetical protein